MGRGNRERRFVRCACGNTEIVLDPYAIPPRKCRKCRKRGEGQ